MQQASRHEMFMTNGKTAGNQCFVTLQIDQTNVCAVADQNIAVATLQCGARDDTMCARAARLVDPASDRAEPGPTVLVAERNAVVHLVNVRRRMKPIGILKLPSQTAGKERPNS